MFRSLKMSCMYGAILLGIAGAPVEAAPVTTVANGQWNLATVWSDGSAPSTDNNYLIGSGFNVNANTLAGSNGGTTSYSFQGGSLQVQSGGTLTFSSSTTSNGQTGNYTVGSGLILDSGSTLVGASSASTTLWTIMSPVTLASTGSVTINMVSGGGASASQGLSFGSALSGGANINLNIDANGATGIVVKNFRVLSANNAFTGNWVVTSTNATASRLGWLSALAPNALGTGTVTLTNSALRNAVADGLNSLSGVSVGNLSLIYAAFNWTNPNASVDLTASNASLQLLNANTAVSIGNLSGVAGSTVTGAGAGNSLTVNITDNIQFAGTLANSGSGTLALAKTGPATWTLTGTNTYTGGTRIDGGTLQIGAGGTLGSLAGNVVDNGSLAFNRSDALTFAGSISGSGGVSQLGTGTTTFTANQTYTGGTLISAGTLQLGNGGTSGSLVGNVVNNGALSINRSDTVTLPGVISGSGRLVNAGAGTTILAADNTYTGGTTISAGTLQLGNGSASGSVVGNIVDNGNLVFDRAGTLTLAGLISGSGAVEQRGVGTTVFTADHTYTGGTTISGGTLQLGDGGTTGSVAGNIVDNGTLAVNHSNDIFFLTPITGSGALVQRGAGRTVLSAANTYTGGTTINAGTLQVGNGFTSGSIVGDVVDNGMLTFNRSNTLTFDGTISGMGAVTKLGSGITILTADNTYTGGTTIAASSGSLQLGNGGTSGSIVGDVLNDGALTINRTDTLTLPGTISGSGALSQRGTGTTILTADNTYTGGSFIAAGTLQLGAGGTSGSILGNITNNGTLAFNRSDTVAFSNIISGTGGVNQLGPGTLQLDGDQTYTGPTQISAGTLALIGSLQSNNVTVAPGATLSGTGIINGDVLNQGRVWPGSAVAGATDYAA
ncbi:autotransporter-associated beta strand repeat-containing protein [Pinirhizobacter soli]|uniref:autotransporter-associated beta strand repeat-containing protein n=1 Tax=Pinirhizobacter soli TaxID=2786953 RepID=UPI00202A43F1|nr:autotransporter-associated beta strand repeat-containing protein [Pinirhizobacter soli]